MCRILLEELKETFNFLQACQMMFCPPSSQFAVYNKIKSEKDLLVYPDFGHEKLTDMLDLQLQFILEGSHEIKSI